MSKINNQGFTLIETVIYIALLAIIIIFLVSFFSQATFIKGKINERLDNLDNAQYALDRMTWYLQNSLEITEPLAGQTSETLVMNSLVSQKNPVKFYIEDKKLKMQIGDEAPLNLTNNRLDIKEISFSSQGFVNQPALIQIRLTVQGNHSLWQTQPLTLQTSVKLEK